MKLQKALKRVTHLDLKIEKTEPKPNPEKQVRFIEQTLKFNETTKKDEVITEEETFGSAIESVITQRQKTVKEHWTNQSEQKQKSSQRKVTKNKSGAIVRARATRAKLLKKYCKAIDGSEREQRNKIRAKAQRDEQKINAQNNPFSLSSRSLETDEEARNNAL